MSHWLSFINRIGWTATWTDWAPNTEWNHCCTDYRLWQCDDLEGLEQCSEVLASARALSHWISPSVITWNCHMRLWGRSGLKWSREVSMFKCGSNLMRFEAVIMWHCFKCGMTAIKFYKLRNDDPWFNNFFWNLFVPLIFYLKVLLYQSFGGK